MLTRRSFSAALAAAALTRPAHAQALPKTARIVVGFPPGGSSDIAARLLAERMKNYAPTLIVENKPGGGGRLALEMAKSGPTDGSLVVLSPMSMVVIYPHTHRTLGYKPLEDFIRESIVDPNAYVEQGFPKGVMPPFSTLPKDQLDALVQYLAESAKGAK